VIRLLLCLTGLTGVFLFAGWGGPAHLVHPLAIVWGVLAGGYGVVTLIAWRYGQPVRASVFRSTPPVRWATVWYFVGMMQLGIALSRKYPPGFTVGIAAFNVLVVLLSAWTMMSLRDRRARRRATSSR
jgi:hypothetical protein